MLAAMGPVEVMDLVYPHLHLAYYTFDSWGRARFLPMAFTVSDFSSGEVTGVPRSNERLEAPVSANAQSNRPLLDQLFDAFEDAWNATLGQIFRL